MEELFFNKELSDVSFDVEALDEWKQTCKDLGLDAQLSLTKGKDSPIPYPFINTTMERVYKTICPANVEYKEYKKTTMPLVVLKQIAFSVKENHFEKIEIWYDDKAPDPIAVGFHGYWYEMSWYDNSNKDLKDHKFSSKEEAIANGAQHPSFATEEKYIIARWGDELRDFSELKTIARDRLVDKYANEYKMTISNCQSKLNAVNENVTAYLAGDISESSISSTSTPF